MNAQPELQLFARLAEAQRNGQGSQQAPWYQRLQDLVGGGARVVGVWGPAAVVKSATRGDAVEDRHVLELAHETGVLAPLAVFPLPRGATLVLHLHHRSIGLRACLFGLGALTVLDTAFHPGAMPLWPHISMLCLLLLAAVLLWSDLRGRSSLRTVAQSAFSQAITDSERLTAVTLENQHATTLRSLLQEADHQFRHTLHEEGVAAHLASYLRRIIPDSDGLAIFSLDRQRAELSLFYADGRHLPLLETLPSHQAERGITGQALLLGRTYIAESAARDPHILPYLGTPYGSAVAIPLTTVESDLGAVLVTRAQEGALPADQVWAAELLAGLASLRIQALRARRRELDLVQDFAAMFDLVNWRPDGDPQADPLEPFAAHLKVSASAGGYVILRVTESNMLELTSSDGINPKAAEVVRSCVRSVQLARIGTVTYLTAENLCTNPRYAPAVEAIGLKRTACIPVTTAQGRPLAFVVLLFYNLDATESWPELLSLWETYARYAGVAAHNRALYGTVLEQSHQLRDLLGQVVEAQEAERRRIALDLHDWMALGLAAPSLRLQVAEQLLDTAPAVARTEIEVAVGMLGEAGNELRRIMKGLRPYLLDELGLYRAVQALAADWSKSTGIAITVEKEPSAKIPPGSVQCLAAFRVVQEALNNVAKHSRAKQVAVRIARDGDHVRITVADDGAGLTPGRKGLGLLGMQERAELVGGSLSIGNSPSGGCIVTCTLPLSLQT